MVVVVGEMDRVMMGILLVDLMVGTAKAVKGRMETLGTMEDRKAALVQEATEARMETLAQEARGNRTKILDQEAMGDRTATPAQEATEAQTATPAQETMEDRKTAQAPITGLASRIQALSRKSTCTRRS